MSIKRSPLHGRSFEYVWDDPLSGGGNPRDGDGCLKHCPTNKNRKEKARLVEASNVYERVLREVYLRGFEIAVREERPWAVMWMHNRVNGT